ncbi:protein SAR DEFICIENT 1-like isoform X1 [Typha latifolia]|uniref:protein SAR DEFICIENT 1-like isoform X1 n=1 Tax=Typha latifolia TaxID=4733 RepID=UPI003C2EB3C9
MAAKRLHEEFDQDPEKPEDKRVRRLPSFSTVIREAVMRKSLQNFFAALEPMLRRVVQEEVQRGLVHSPRLIERPPLIPIEAIESSSLKLVFKNMPAPPIFSGNKVEDAEANPLQILLVNAHTGECSPSSLPSPIRVEIVVLDGDFPSNSRDDWTNSEFQRSIVKERVGKRPLLTGEVNVTLRDGRASLPELMFTDNSSWIRSRNFRIGARILPGSYDGPRIKEAITDPFMVKDHRGELYKKHYPPSLSDEVWRLERIGKDGTFHKRLSDHNISTVQDFLKLWAVNQDYLRLILGQGMSDKMWEGTIEHAKTCNLGDKLYVHRVPQCTLLLNSICKVVKIIINGVPCTMQDLGATQQNWVLKLVQEAYQQWHQLEEVDGGFNPSIPLLQNESELPGVPASLPWHDNNEVVAVDHPLEVFEEFENHLQLQSAFGALTQWGQMYHMTG